MQTAETIPLRRQRDFGEVLNVTFLFLRQNIGLLAKSLLFIAGPALVLGVILNPFAGATGFFFNPGEWQAPETESGTALFGARVILATLLSCFGTVLAIAVANEFLVLYQDRGAGRFELEDVWRRARRSLWRMTGTLLLLGFLFGVSALIVLVPCLGALAYLAGVVYFGVLLSLVFIVQAREQAGVLTALSRSRALVRGNWWPTAGVVFVSGIVYYAMSVCFALPSIVVSGFAAFHGIEGESSSGLYGVLGIVFGAVASLGSLLLYAVPLVAVAFQYFSLVEQKDRTGLMERVEAMERAAQTSETSEGGWPPSLGPIAPAGEAGTNGNASSNHPRADARPEVGRSGEGSGEDTERPV